MIDYTPYKQFAADVLDVEFRDWDLLLLAFTHRSYVNEHRKTAKEHNERMEFLGDAVLELVVTEFLYENFNEPEGVLTNWRSALVRTESIGTVAKANDFASLLRLSRGEKRGSERARDQILANTFESVVGAIYLDQGYEAAKKFISEKLLVTLDGILESGSWMDPKSRLQEQVQSQDSSTPVYRVIKEDGPDHDKTFTVGVFVDGKLCGQGTGPSKQAGQVAAAEQALQNLQNETQPATT